MEWRQSAAAWGYDDSSIENLVEEFSEADSNLSQGAEERKEDQVPMNVSAKKQFIKVWELFRFSTWLDCVSLLVGALCAFASGASTPLFMYFYGQLITQVYSQETITVEEITRRFAILMVCLASMTSVLCLIYSSIYLIFSSRTAARLKYAFFCSVVHQDIAWHDNHKPGELISRLLADVNIVLNGINDRFANGIQNIGVFTIGLTVSFLSCWQVALVILASFPLIAFFGALLIPATMNFVKIARDEYAKANSIAIEIIENIKTVKVFNREVHEIDKFALSALQSRSTGIKKEFTASTVGGMTFGLTLIALGCSFVLGAHLVKLNKANSGGVATAVLALLYGAAGMGQFLPTLISFNEARTAASPLYEVIDRTPEIEVNHNGIRHHLYRCIEYRNVAFKYGNRPNELVFSDFNLVINCGTKIAFTGQTGCGKSTLLALLQRFYDPINGGIYIDGIDLRQLSLQDWRSQIGVVEQEPSLFSGTVLNNVRMGKPNATVEEVMSACKRARIHDTIIQLPKQYDTSIGAVGSQLSGGQKQRIAIARALLRDVRLLLLDEATSALDRVSEIEVQAAIDGITRETPITVITIAHRLSTIRNMDCIYHLENDGAGAFISEQGTFDELWERNGKFAEMIKLQGGWSSFKSAQTPELPIHYYREQQESEQQESYSSEVTPFSLNKHNGAKCETIKCDESNMHYFSNYDYENIDTYTNSIATENKWPLFTRDKNHYNNVTNGTKQYDQTTLRTAANEIDNNTDIEWDDHNNVVEKFNNNIVDDGSSDSININEVRVGNNYHITKRDNYLPKLSRQNEKSKNVWWAADKHKKSHSRVNQFNQRLRNSPMSYDPDDEVCEDNLTTFNNVEDVPFAMRTRWEEERTKLSLLRLFVVGKHEIWAIILGLVGSFATALIIPLGALFITQLISILGTYEINRNEDEMRHSMWMYVGLFWALGVFAFCGSVLTAFYGYAGEHLTYKLRTILFEQIVRQDQVFFDMPARGPGSLTSILAGDCEAVHQLYGPALGSRLKAVVSLIGGLIIGLVVQWKVALVAFSTMPLLFTGAMLQQMFFYDSPQRNDKSKLGVVISESFSSIRTVHNCNLIDRVCTEFASLLNTEEYTIERRCLLISVLSSLFDFMNIATVALTYWYGGTLVARDEATFGGVMVATIAVMMASSFAGAEAGGFATKMRMARKAARRVFSIIDRVPSVDTYRTGIMDIGDGCDISFNNVNFSYPARPGACVMDDFNATFVSGNSSGVMGQTGCGKSTIVQLLSCCYQPCHGVITINGYDLNSLDIVTWRANLSIVLQEPALFSGTIRENICYSLPQATENEIRAAARLACIDDEIMSFNEGYDTEVGYHGRGLSGGQKQRVAIARAVIRCPRLLLLDEATSALDSQTESIVSYNLKKYQEEFGVTIVSIAHRLSTIEHCDQILLLVDGKVIERGTHQELLALNGEYSARWHLSQQ